MQDWMAGICRCAGNMSIASRSLRTRHFLLLRLDMQTAFKLFFGGCWNLGEVGKQQRWIDGNLVAMLGVLAAASWAARIMGFQTESKLSASPFRPRLAREMSHKQQHPGGLLSTKKLHWYCHLQKLHFMQYLAYSQLPCKMLCSGSDVESLMLWLKNK